MNFKIIENGEEINCEVVMTFSDYSNNINYIVYTDGTLDSNNNLEVYASRYIVDNDSYILNPIEKEYEWNLIDNLLENLNKESV